ncbi:hypothetical protein DFQ27_002750 [Actinomortierella ambigua]|uniref:Glutathione S-transferase n=1 Tax=Actinomortierella ambigua TaxID=1343610 RepID=A0A9P6QB51_9FUNG|nr:hypothetical protein DFQ26_002574 [Actinomortierella ambigua]KAG0261827.1 hypothetical protein DFQ27_002750 [Actinomortierella ambigua]
MVPFTNNKDAVHAIVGAKDAHYELEYFPVLFNSTGTRALLAYAGFSNKQTPIAPPDWPTYKPKTPNGYLPVLKVTKGPHHLNLCEVIAIDQFLGRQANLLGKDAYEEAVILAHHSSAQATFFESTMLEFFWPTVAQDDKAKQAGLEKLKTKIAEWARVVEGHLAANGDKGVLVGDSVTVADIKVVATVLALRNVMDAHHVDGLVTKEKTPRLLQLEKKLLEKDSYREWIESDAFVALKKGSEGFSRQFHSEFFVEK